MLPYALFNTCALFNPFQYKPFFEVFKLNENGEYILNRKNLFINDEVGVGKTFEVGIIISEILNQNPNAKILILSPTKLCFNLEDEILNNFMISFNNYNKIKKRWKDGIINNEVNRLIIPFTYLTYLKKNYDKEIEETNEIETEETEDIKEELNKEEEELLENKIKHLKYDVLIIDEAHNLRNKNKLYHGVQKLAENNKEALKIFMTATPIFNTEQDYANITNLLDDENGFSNTVTLQGEANIYENDLEIKKISIKNQNIKKFLNENEDYKSKHSFYERIATSSYYALYRHLVRILDPTNFKEDLASFKEAPELKKLKQPKIDKEKTKIFTKKVLEKFIKLDKEKKELIERDDWNNLVLDRFEFSEEDKKFECLKELLDKILEDEVKKVVIFSSFIDTCLYIGKRLELLNDKNYKIFYATGRQNAKKIQESLVNFEKEDRPAIIICSDVAKEGFNMQFSKYLIEYDYPYTPASLQQRNGRIYRKGQKNKPIIYNFFVEDSYDDRVYGGILFEKSEIIHRYAQKGLICDINIFSNSEKDNVEEDVKSMIYYINNKCNSNIEKLRYILNKVKNCYSEKEICERNEIIDNELVEKFIVYSTDINDNLKKIEESIKIDSELNIINNENLENDLKRIISKYYNKIIKGNFVLSNSEDIRKRNADKYHEENENIKKKIFNNELTTKKAMLNYIKEKLNKAEIKYSYEANNGVFEISKYKKKEIFNKVLNSNDIRDYKKIRGLFKNEDVFKKFCVLKNQNRKVIENNENYYLKDSLKFFYTYNFLLDEDSKCMELFDKQEYYNQFIALDELVKLFGKKQKKGENINGDKYF